MPPTHRILTTTAGVGCAAALAWGAMNLAQDPEPLDPTEHGWIHEDIEAGYREAIAAGKPLLVAFR